MSRLQGAQPTGCSPRYGDPGRNGCSRGRRQGKKKDPENSGKEHNERAPCRVSPRLISCVCEMRILASLHGVVVKMKTLNT